jgi:hypothetical protein
VDGQLKILIDLQALDTRIAGLEAEAAKLPREIAAVRASVDEARKAVDAGKARLDAAKKDTRAKEKDLEVTQAKRQKVEARLYEVKTNKEYSAALVEIEQIKQEKAGSEEEILTLMEMQERLTVEIKEAEGRFKAREAQGRSEEAALQEKLKGVETDLALVRGDRNELARQVPPAALADYERLLRARGGLALAPIIKPNLCAGCRMTVTPQRIQELRQQTVLLPCESCGRYLYWVA